jgi:hypothetical protein
MVHATLIGLHAATGGVALLLGLVAHRGRLLFAGFQWSLVASIGFLVVVIVEEWGRLDAVPRVLFPAFVVLGAYMIGRVVLAGRIQPAGGRPSAAYVAHVGFGVVGLFDAFVVITVLNAGAPVPVVVGAGVLVAIAGHLAIRAVRARLAPVPATA